MPKVPIKKSVGLNGVNDPDDVIVIKKRLIELGFDWLEPDEKVGPVTVDAIRLFQAIKNGFDNVKVSKNDGLINVDRDTHHWLEAANAPRWQRMPAGSKAEGYLNDEVADTSDNHDFGTDWLAETLRATGAAYRDDYLSDHPSAALFRINDTSKPRGGDTSMHVGHESGLVCDVRLPRQDGSVGGITVTSPNYDRDAMRAIIKAFRRQKLADRVLLNDQTLINEGLCRAASGHHNHAHFEIRPPVLEMDAAAPVEGVETIEIAASVAATAGSRLPRAEFGKLLNLKEDLIPKGNDNRPGDENSKEFITVHNTSYTGKGADAASHARFVKEKGFNIVNGKKIIVSWHYTVDDKQIIKHLPINEKAFHAHAVGNRKSIGIEICMHEGIDQEAAFLRAARLIAALRFDLGLSNDAIVTHLHWTKKKCPTLLLDGGKEGKKWDAFKKLIDEQFALIA